MIITEYPIWIRLATAEIVNLVARASLSGSPLTNTQIAAIIQQEYNIKEKQDAES